MGLCLWPSKELRRAILGTIESQTQPDRVFFQNLANCAEVERQREAVAVVRAMAELADVPTQSVMEADGDDDMTSAGHVTKSCGRRWVTARKPNEN